MPSSDVETLLDWHKTAPRKLEVPFKPARVVLQDYSGLAAIIDLAGMRDAYAAHGRNPSDIRAVGASVSRRSLPSFEHRRNNTQRNRY